MNDTHDPSLHSWVPSASAPETDFPIQNLPFGVFRRRGKNEQPRVGVAIGDMILDLAGCTETGLFEGEARMAAEACGGTSLNALMGLGRAHASALRSRLSALLRSGPEASRHADRLGELLTPRPDVEMFLPACVGDYTDFYASIHHATNVGRIFRPDSPLLPNYRWLPIGYHGRASSLVASEHPIIRPRGQTHPAGPAAPGVRSSARLDYECEVGVFVGAGNPLGQPVPLSEAEEHLFGFCLVNDWSARDIQAWEYQPLGPFLGKSFATSVSPWVVTLDALEPFRSPLARRETDDPAPLPYLDDATDRARGGVGLTVEVWLSSARMRAAEMRPVRLSAGRATDLYWSFAQMLTHHTSNGCNLRPGDLLASGTVSGPEQDSAGCLLELTRGGTRPIQLPSGEHRTFLEDGDEVILRGYCERGGWARIGLGECRGMVLASGGSTA